MNYPPACMRIVRRRFVPMLLFIASSVAVIPEAQCVAQSPGQQLEQLISDAWEFKLRESPLLATSVGDKRYNGELARVSVDDARRRNAARDGFVSRLKEIVGLELNDSDRLNATILQRLLEQEIAEFDFETFYTPITNREGFHISFPQLPKKVPLTDENDYQNYISRLQKFRQYAAEHVQLMRAGMAKGYMLPAVVLEGYREPLDANIVDDPKTSLLYGPFLEFPDSIPDASRAELARAAETAIRDSVLPGYQEFLQFMSEEYVPNARDTIAAAALPNGRDYYRYCVKKFTTLDMLPEEVHEIGNREVARIRGEMQQIIDKLKFEGDFAAFVEFLRTDPQFYPQTSEQLLSHTAMVLKKIDGMLPRLFKTLPRTPYGIRVIPEYIAPRTTTAYYMPPRGDGTEAGFYYVNTFNLKSRPLYEIEALSLHEAVPGHHLQIALQQELDELPDFRRFSGFTAYVEGWALYAERLGLEVGFYEDPYSDFGRLTYEMWRACRLVVDTGVHYLGWTRPQAIEFMEQNTALSKHNIRAEVDRYISWPGQALGYKIGELKIRELRERAKETLGSKFDVREFHEVVLLSGAVPLDVLERQVEDYISGQQQ